MGYALRKEATAFTLRIRCENCMRESERVLEMPEADGVPRDPDELVESALLANLPFGCRPCGGVIGQVIGIDVARGF